MLCLALSACGDPLAGIERLSDVEGAQLETAANLAAPTDQIGLLSRLFGFGREGASEPAPDAAQVPPGAMLPYGEIATICGLAPRELGTRIDSASGFEIYDTHPGSTAPRTHYITGLSDGCARQFTGALVLTGDVATHEMVRYEPSNASLPYSDTDDVYEAIKARICRVGHRTPCGQKLDRLAADTAFVTVYETFGTAPNWVEILLHDGAVAAIGPKSR